MSVHIPIRADDTHFVMTEDGEFVCDHHDAEILRACCSPSSRIIECGCGGQDSVICNAPRCTGIMDWEVEELFERLENN